MISAFICTMYLGYDQWPAAKLHLTSPYIAGNLYFVYRALPCAYSIYNLCFHRCVVGARLSTEYVFCTMEPVYSDHNFCGPPWQVVSLDRCICKLSFTIYISYDTIHAAYINYGQCRVCRCRVQRLHSAMCRHSITLVLVSWASLSTWRMIVGTILALYINYGQYCVCWCLVRLHPAMGRHDIVLMLVSWALLSTFSIMHVAYIERVNTVPADVWCRDCIQSWADTA